LLGTGREDDKSILNEILDRWIAFLDIYDTDIQAKKKSKEEHEQEDKNAEARRN